MDVNFGAQKWPVPDPCWILGLSPDYTLFRSKISSSFFALEVGHF